MKKILLGLIFLSLVLPACNTRSGVKNEASGGNMTELKVNPNTLVSLDVSIKGMTCTGCENTVKSCISELPGVVEVSASFKDGKAIVKLDTALTKFNNISNAVNSRGYSVTGYKLAQ